MGSSGGWVATELIPTHGQLHSWLWILEERRSSPTQVPQLPFGCRNFFDKKQPSARLPAADGQGQGLEWEVIADQPQHLLQEPRPGAAETADARHTGSSEEGRTLNENHLQKEADADALK